MASRECEDLPILQEKNLEGRRLHARYMQVSTENLHTSVRASKCECVHSALTAERDG